MDDLLVAVFQASAQRDAKLQSAALASTRPLHALWELNKSIPRCRINIAFIALCAVHEKLRQEMQKVEERARSKQLTALEQLFSTREIDQKLYTPLSITMLIATAARTVAMETTVGISLGHSELAQLVERILDELEPHQLASGDASKPRQTNFGEASSTSGRLSYAPD
jgi:TetR/AcrR family transcriptional regulator, regulator of autoinduction and epiphytic fitness